MRFLVVFAFFICQAAWANTLAYTVAPHFEQEGGSFSVTIEGELSEAIPSYFLPAKYQHLLGQPMEQADWQEGLIVTFSEESFPFNYTFSPVEFEHDPKQPYITDDYFILPLQDLLLPNTPDDQNLLITLDVVLPEGMHWFSYQGQDTPLVFEGSIEELKKKTILGGRFTFAQLPSPFEQATVLLDPHMSDEVTDLLLEQLPPILKAQHDFWLEELDAPYTLSFRQRHDGRSKLEGTHYENMMLFFCPTSDVMLDVQPFLAHGLSHEFFHRWMGVRLQPAKTQDADYLLWLIEAFTDYYGLYFAEQAGLLSEEELQTILDKFDSLIDQNPIICGHCALRQWAKHYENPGLFSPLIQAIVQEQSSPTLAQWTAYLSEYLPEDIATSLIQGEPYANYLIKRNS